MISPLRNPKVISLIAHIKVIVFYGAETLYPFFTLFTAVGVAKIAFGIPAPLAAVIMFFVVFGVGFIMFKIGIFGKDLDIKWNNTPSAKEVLDRIRTVDERIEKWERSK